MYLSSILQATWFVHGPFWFIEVYFYKGTKYVQVTRKSTIAIMLLNNHDLCSVIAFMIISLKVDSWWKMDFLSKFLNQRYFWPGRSEIQPELPGRKYLSWVKYQINFVFFHQVSDQKEICEKLQSWKWEEIMILQN